MAATNNIKIASTAQQRRSCTILCIIFNWIGFHLNFNNNNNNNTNTYYYYYHHHHHHDIVGRLLLYSTALLLFIDSIAIAQHLRPPSEINARNDSHGICKSVDIRNTLETFNRLKNCRVVEGFVQILLFDNVNETLVSNISFPELTEITEYLLLYRVSGLRSVGQLFPNLAVIRGQNTFYSYAFVVFEMSSLQEIALYSLTDITHGLIRIDKNPSLCFVNSINWDLIAHEKGDHFIKSLKPDNECPVCPGDEKIKVDEFGTSLTSLACPKSPHKPAIDSFERERHLCWNRQHCQKICPSYCRSCNRNGVCCNEKCLGGCSVNSPNNCTVCRNLSMGFGYNRQCLSECPKNFYEYLGRRCVTYQECVNMRKPIELHSRTEAEYPYKIFNNSCVIHCPTNYMNDKNHGCKPCKGRCRKECPGLNVDSITLAKQLRGCTHIMGSLEIQIRGGRNVVNELEENLSMIEEIQGYLKVVRSFPLVSLNFLKSLKRIRGKYLENQKYVFIVLDNQNLQDLWDLKNRTLQIETGRLFFHFNPKLCLKKIEQLQRNAKLDDFDDLEVASNSNGDKIACDVENLNVTVKGIESKAVILEWKQFHMEDQRKLLGYIVYSIEAQHQNVTLYDGRDACGGDGWRVDDVAIPEDENSTLTHLLVQLKAYTQYAFYVKTYTIATERRGAQSKIQYFRTLPSVPSVPQGLQVTSNASDSLKLTWYKPLHPNGNVTHYIVAGKKHKNAIIDDLKKRDYCNTPENTPKHPLVHPSPPVAPPPSSNQNNDTCSCDESKPQSKGFDESEEISRIKFEDELQNEVYIKKENIESRRKRETHELLTFPKTSDNNLSHNSNNNEIKNTTENGTDIWESFSFKIYGKTEFYLNNLHHFTYYDIYVQACREKEGKMDTENHCSSTSIKTARTQLKEGADEIRNVQITNQSLEMVYITWDEPIDPNGMVFTYSIEYKRMDNENSKPTLECITQNDFLLQNRIHTLKKLQPGNYSLRIFASSSAGNGEFSDYIYFHIKEPTSNTSLVISLVFFTTFSVVTILALLYYKKRKTDKESMRLIPSVNPEYVPSVYVPDEWEVPRKKIELIRELGQGSFGMVYEGIACDIRGKDQMKCAVKTVNEHATNRERLEFLNEASVMKAFDTSHVVRLLGVVSQGQPTLVIMELMANGDLKSYLRSHRPDAEGFDPNMARHPPSLRQILQMAMEISDGMAYLSAKKFVHRDLAARNCMVAEDLTVKIGDFGMTRDIYETDYYRKGTKGLLPVRWMAPESLKDGVFTSYSDVWSYGVVLWEMATLASQPYQGLSNDQVLRYVIDGGVMERPENCPDKLYTLMRFCWQHKPSARPSFLRICSLLLDDANPNFPKVSFYHSPAGIEARTLRSTPSQSQDDPSTPLRIAEGEEYDDSTYSPTNSDDESELVLGLASNSRLSFPPSISIDTKDGLTAANGYVGGGGGGGVVVAVAVGKVGAIDDGGGPTNGAATTQC